MTPIHEAAARGYERGAGDYEKGRPSYPQAAIDRLVDVCAVGAGRRIVDLGAGTGKFTRYLHEHGADVIAVEPVRAMRSAYNERFPGAPILDGTAEDVPLRDGWADVVTVAQAFHWFDAVPALDEIARVLRTGGWLALIWNTRDPEAPWTATINRVLDRLAGDAPRFRSSDPEWRRPLDAHPAFDELASASFTNDVPMDLETMLARIASTSYVSALPDEERAAVLDEVAELVRRGPMAEQGPRFVERYRTELFWCRRR